MRAVYIGDPHLSNVDINSRKDQSSETCLNKLDQVFMYALDHKIDTVIATGDIFSNTISSILWFNKLTEILYRYKGTVNFKLIPGNHSGDILGKDFYSYKDRALGILEHAELIEVLSVGTIVGLGAYQYRTQKELEEIPFRDKTKIVVAHYFLDTAFPGEDLLISKENLTTLFPNAKVFVLGHDHSYHPPMKFGEAMFFRPGSLMREKCNEVHTPMLLDITLTDDGVVYEEVLLKAEAHSAIFTSVEVKDIEKEAQQQMSRFKDSMEQVKTITGDITDIVQDIMVPLGTEIKELFTTDLRQQGFVL